MSLEFRNPFHPDSAPIHSNEEGLEDLEEGVGEAMAQVLGTEGPLPTENPFNSFPSDAPSDPLESFLTKEQKALKERMKEAEAIFNKETPEGKTERHFFGPEQIKEAFGIELLLADVPEIPYTPDQLREAEKQGYELVLRVAKDGNGAPMTGIHMFHLLKEKHGDGENSWGETFKVGGSETNILHKDYDPDREWDPADPANQGKPDLRPWFTKTKEDFFYKDSLQFEWKLEARSFLPGSEGKNYIEQTRLLRNTLKEQGALTAEEEEECTDQKLQELTILISTNWQEASKQLANLQITKNHRRSFVEALYGQFLRQATGGQDFKNSFVDQLSYDWTSSRRSGDALVYFGCVDCDGAHVRSFYPGVAADFLGLLLVR